MRILYVTRRAWPALGGIETLVHNIAQGISPDHDIGLIALRIDDGPFSLTSDGPRLPAPFEPFLDGRVTVSPLVLTRSRRLALAPLFLQEVPLLRRYAFSRARVALVWLYAHVVASQLQDAAAKADVVHIWGDGFPAAAALLAAHRAGRPVVITPFMHRRQWGDDVASVAVYKRADRVAALLEPEAQQYRDLGVSPNRVLVAGACSPGVGSPRAAGLRRRHSIVGPLVLYLAVRSEHKGFHLLLEAGRRIPAAAGVTIAIAGPGPPLEPSGNPEGARVIDLGTLSAADRADWLHAADMLCLPSAGETFGMVLLEAWSAGTPVVTSDIPSLRELVTKSGGGRIVARDAPAFAEAICTLAEDPQQLQAMGSAGRRYWQEHCTVERVARWHESLYEELCVAGRR
jgi:glycosyltransferase involved in cell wall biosynthesis